MARARNIKPSFFTDDEIAELHPLGRLLFQGLWCIADRAGRLEDRPKRIQTEVLPYDKSNVDALLMALHDGRFIIRYEVDGRRYIQIRQFLKHQDPHYKEKPSEIPPPPGWVDKGSKSSGSSGQSSASDRSINGQSTINDRSKVASTIPELTLDEFPLIPDSGFLIPDSFNRFPVSGSPPPDSGLPQPAARAPATARAPPNGGTTESKPVEKDRTAKVNGHFKNPAKEAVDALAVRLGIKPKRTELYDEYAMRVIDAGKANGIEVAS